MSPVSRKAISVLLAGAVFPLGCAVLTRRPAAAQKRGQELYTRTCAVCHGENGQGYKADRAPALANPGFLSSASDEFLRRAIAEGRSGTTMSAWASEHGGPLTAADIHEVISFMREWNSRPGQPLDERPVTGSATHGKALFAAQCSRCHGAGGAGGPNNRLADPVFLQSAGNGFLRAAIRGGRRKTAMPAFGEDLGDAGIEDIVAFLRSLPSSVPAAPTFAPPLPLGPVPLNPSGPQPLGFLQYPAMTSVEVAKAQFDLHAKMAFLDARAPSNYVEGHIAGAVSVPFYDPSPYLAALPKDAWLVCYCACPHAESGQLARKLIAAGFSKVTVLDEGFNVWKARNYGTRTGASP